MVRAMAAGDSKLALVAAIQHLEPLPGPGKPDPDLHDLQEAVGLSDGPLNKSPSESPCILARHVSTPDTS